MRQYALKARALVLTIFRLSCVATGLWSRRCIAAPNALGALHIHQATTLSAWNFMCLIAKRKMQRRGSNPSSRHIDAAELVALILLSLCMLVIYPQCEGSQQIAVTHAISFFDRGLVACASQTPTRTYAASATRRKRRARDLQLQ